MTYEISGTEIGDYTGAFTGKGSESVTAEGVEGDLAANYSFEYKEGALEIVASSDIEGYVELTPAPVSEVYDGQTYTAGTASATDKVNGKEVKVEYRVKAAEGQPENAWTTDPSTIKATQVSDSVTVEVRATCAAYSGEIVKEQELTITQRPVSATGSATKVYDGTDALLGNVDLTLGTTALSESGVVEGDDVYATAIAQDAAKYASADAHENEPLVAANGGELIALTGLAGGDAANYELVSVTATGTITKQTIDPGPDPDNPDPSYANVVVSEPDDVTYNGQHQQSPVTVTRVDGEGNVIATLLEKVDYTLTYANDVNAGVETATVTVKGVGNYKGEVVKHYTINKADAVITVNDDSKEYGDNDPAFTGAVTLTDGSPLYINALTGVVDIIGDVTYSRTNSDEDADTYPGVLTATVANANGNYTYTVEPGDFTISRAGDNNVTIETAVEDRSKTYDGQPITIDATATESGSTLLYSTDGQSWSETKPTLTNVGSLTIYVKATNPNYEDSAVVSATVQVTPATLTVTTDSLGKVFDGTALTAGGKVTGFVNNETATFAVTGSQTEVGSSVNDYSLVFDQTAQQSNYTLVEELGTLTVWPQSIDPEDPDPDKPDPDDPDPTDPDPDYDPDDPDPEDPDQPFYTGIKVQGPDPQMYDAADQTPGVVVTDKNGKVLEEGTDYRITGYDNNYNVTTEDSLAIIHVEGIGNYRGNVDVEFEITPAPLTVTTPSAGKVYDGSALTAGPADVEGLQGSDATAVTITANGTQTDVGNSVNGVSYDWGQVLASNYSITEDLGALTVWPQSIDPTDPGENPDPDDPDAPDPSDPDPDFPGEDPDPDNPVVPDQPFYTGAEVDYPQDVSYNGTDQTWVPTVTDAEGNLLTEGEDYEVSYSTDDRTNATGDITVTITGKGNYAGTITREYQITPLEIDVYIENQTKVEGEADPTFTFNYEGVLEGESMGWAGAFVRDAGEAAGTYNVAQGGFVLADNEAGNFLASNYTLTVHPGTLTITAAPVPPGPDDPDPVTPVTPLPTPDPTPVPTPTPGDPGATETTTTPATEEATETIDDEATPLTAPEPIDDDATPLASGAHRDCWVHWLMLLGILVTVVYYGGVGVRRVRFSSSLQSFEDDVLGNDETNR